MAFCSRCGTQVGPEAVFCPNCGAAIASQVTPRAIQAPETAAEGPKYLSTPFLYCMILSAIVIFATLVVGASQGELVTVDEAQQSLREVEEWMADFTGVAIFANNVQISLIAFIPLLGSIWMVFVQYNTGYLFGNIAKAYGVHFVSIIQASLFSPTGLLEYCAYILTLSESVMIVYSLVKRGLRRRLTTQTWKTIGIVVGLLLVGGIVEAIALGRPIL